MDARSRIRLGTLAVVLVASCGTRALTKDGGSVDGDAGGATGTAPAGIGGAGAATGSGIGIAGQPGGGRDGGSGIAGSAGGGPTGTGGFVGTGGVGGSGGVSGRGGTGVSSRGGTVGTGGAIGMGGAGGVGGVGGRGGFSGTAGSGTGGVSGVSGRGGMSGVGGTSGTGGGGVSGTFGTGGGGSGGTGGTGGTGGGGIGGGGTGGSGGTGGTAGTGGIGGMSGRGGMSGTGGGVCLTCRTTVLPIAALDLAYNPIRNELYASVPGDAAVYPNRIVVIDPSTSSVVSTIPIGSNPRTLAVSDDGATLWVGIDGAHAFRKVTLGSPPVVGPLIHLPKSMPTTYYDATAMAVLPGATPSLAIALYDGYTGDVRVFDDGVSRGGGATNGLTAYSLAAGPPGLLFGASSYGFLVLRVGASGIDQSTPFFGLLRGYSNSLVYTGGKVFAQTGEVLDVSNPSSPLWTTSLGAQGPIALRDPQSLLMLTTTNSSTFPFTLRTEIRITATGMLTSLGSVPVPSTVAPSSAYCRDLVYAGGDTVAFVASDYSSYTPNTRLAIMHDPVFGTPIGGSGGGGGTGGTGGSGGAGGTGGAPDPCPGCSFATAPAYGLHMAADAGRKLIYVAAHAQAVSHPSSIVTVDAAAAAVTSVVPVGNDPQPLALSDDGSALWVGLAGDHRVRRMTPGTTPIPGPAYALPMLLTTNEPASPYALVVLPGTPASIAVGVIGNSLGGRGVFILDDGLLRANYVQPPEVPAYALANGPPGYLLGIGDYNNLVEFKLGSVGATYESYGGLIVGGFPVGITYSAGYLYASTGEVVDLRNPDDPVLNGRFAYSNCLLALRNASRVMMVCPTSDPTGPILLMLDPDTFTAVGSVTLPPSLQAAAWVDFAYLGGDAVALLGDGMPLQIMHAPFIGSPP